ncbi:MAG: hypothetical protein WCG06_04075, partial [Candidatus Omnitrophota bacterium]
MYSIRITSTLFLFGLFLAVGECATGAGVSVKSFGPSSRVLNIRLEQAVERALQNHVLVQTAREKISESRGVWAQTMADLLPQLNSSVHQQRVWHVNMATLGFPAAGVVGPFNAFDARLTFTQKIFDLSAVARSQQGMVG